MKKNFVANLSLLVIVSVLFACTSTEVKHYASDACLIKKGETTKKDVSALFGPPNNIENRPDGSENWYYYHVKEDFVGKLPYVGEKLAKKEIETIKVEFTGDTVSGCYYTVKEEAR